MSYTVAFSPEALAQLDALEDYISDAGSPVIAARFIDSLIRYCEGLCLFPLRGTRRDDLLTHLRITHYRRTTVIAFMVDSDTETVSILGLFYGGQDFTALLQGDGESSQTNKSDQ